MIHTYKLHLLYYNILTCCLAHANHNQTRLSARTNKKERDF